jgi:hypothetical protein
MTASLDTIQLRCEAGLHGIIKERKGKRVFEIRCKNKWCTDRIPGIVVLHYFDTETGKLVDTNKFRDPNVEKTSSNISQFRRKGSR